MIFTQQVNFNNMASSQEFMRVCSEHPECKDCPLKNEDMNVQSGTVVCETGRRKEEK